jgi:signal transduction histidine kinase
MSEPRGAQELNRLKWATVLLPVAFIWGFELVRFLVLEPAYQNDDKHVVAALLMAVAVVVFALVVSAYLDRAQRHLVTQNRDLSLTHALNPAIRGGLPLPDLAGQALDCMIAETRALAGVLVVDLGADGRLEYRRPDPLPGGLSWLEPLLAEDFAASPEPVRYGVRAGLDTSVLDLDLVRGHARVGHLRLLFHPAVRPGVSVEALTDVAGEIATAIELARAGEDLQRRERERAALYEVALQLTGRAPLPEVLDTIAGHARTLLGADRSVVCIDEERPGPNRGWSERLGLTSNGSVCVFPHPGGKVRHTRNPSCPFVDGTDGMSRAAVPLRGPEGSAGELCVVRDGPPFTPGEVRLLGALADMAAVAIRTHRLRDAEEQWTILSERDRIARELHDSLAQVLGTIHLRLRALEMLAADAASGEVARELSDLADTADEAYRDVREAILGLRETISAQHGLEGALREYLAKYSRQTGIAATLACEGDTRAALSPRSEVQLLRVVQEALTNVRKHAAAHRVTVRIDCIGPVPMLIVEDDGVGFDPARVAASFEGGFGMTSMRERVEQIGGSLDVHTAPGEGTRVVVRLDAEEARGTSAPPPASAAR